MILLIQSYHAPSHYNTSSVIPVTPAHVPSHPYQMDIIQCVYSRHIFIQLGALIRGVITCQAHTKTLRKEGHNMTRYKRACHEACHLGGSREEGGHATHPPLPVLVEPIVMKI